jgi:glycosyltransferase involved in cell wall biosynthesis
MFVTPAVPISVLIPARNEARNLLRCLEPLRGWADEVVVADSYSTDGSVAIAESFGAAVVQFDYRGGWPKKRQHVLDTYPFRHEWILLLDSDEILLEPVKNEIAEVIRTNQFDGYWLRFQIHFLGRQLRFGDTKLWKLSLFRRGRGRYEKRLELQDPSMSDAEVHEHVVVQGPAGHLKNPVRHENWNSLDRYIQKHNEYSKWEARVQREKLLGEVRPTLWGVQAQRRRWMKHVLLRLPGSPLLLFFYKYILKMGFLDGVPGLIYSSFQAIQVFHVKSKMYEMAMSQPCSAAAELNPSVAPEEAVRSGRTAV